MKSNNRLNQKPASDSQKLKKALDMLKKVKRGLGNLTKAGEESLKMEIYNLIHEIESK